jgi:hypothetical protein
MLETFLSDTFSSSHHFSSHPNRIVTLKMDAACSFETSEQNHYTTRCKDREDHHLSNTFRANLRMSITHQTIHKILLKRFYNWVNIELNKKTD